MVKKTTTRKVFAQVPIALELGNVEARSSSLLARERPTQ